MEIDLSEGFAHGLHIGTTMLFEAAQIVAELSYAIETGNGRFEFTCQPIVSVPRDQPIAINELVMQLVLRVDEKLAPGSIARRLDKLGAPAPQPGTPWSPGTLAELLIGEAGRLRRGASVLVVANNFRPSLLVALAEVRRRLPVTALWVATEAGHGPPPGLADKVWEVTYASDWATRDALDLAA